MQDEEKVHLQKLQNEKSTVEDKYSSYYAWADLFEHISGILFVFACGISIIAMFLTFICSFIINAAIIGSILIVLSYIVVIPISCIPFSLVSSWYATKISDKYYNQMCNVDRSIKYFTKALNISLTNGETDDD